ncbi:MAG: S8 family serine peptidase [Candidatus Jordarchaeaceae archaeon]
MKPPRKVTALLLIAAFLLTLYAGLTILPQQNVYSANFINNNYGSIESKMDPYLASLIQNGGLHNSSQTRIIIVFQESGFSSGLQALNSMFLDVEVKKIYDYIPAAAITSPLKDIPKIASLPQVIKVWYDYPIQLEPKNLKQSNTPSGEVAPHSNIEALWNENLNGSGILVALLDSGIDTSHPDLDDLDDNSSTSDPKVIASVSMVEYDPFPYDFNGHGTYVAGIIAGTGNASNGTYKGVAPQARLLNVKVFDNEGLSFYSWALSGVEWSVSHGADIIAIPFAGPGYPDDPLCTAVDKAVKSGVTVIAAAGDDGPAYLSVGSPGMALSCITVGSYNSSSGKVCYNSSRGPSFFMWMDPDIVAPGYNITSCRAKTDLGFNISFPFFNTSGYGTPFDENYIRATGTAAATGYVVGVAALLLQALPFLTPEALRVAMMKTAIDLGEDPNTQGAGLLDANATYHYLKNLGEPLKEVTRVYTPGLPYTGFFYTNDSASQLETYCLVGTYGTFVGMMTRNLTSNFNSTHLLQGRFGLKYNGSSNVTPFLLTTVYREMHSTTVPGVGDYERAVTVLGNGEVLIVISVDCWNSTGATGAFRIRITLLNVGNTTLRDLALLTVWDIDLFLNESSYAIDDIGQYNETDDLIYAYDYHNDYPEEVLYVGFKGNVSSAHEVGENDSVLEHFLSDELNNESYYTGSVGLALRWSLSEELGPGSKVDFVGAMGVGGNYSQMQTAINNILGAEAQNVTDLCVVNASIGRLGKPYTPFASDSLILNLGTNVTNATVFFFANKSSDGSSIVYLEIFQHHDLQPLAFRKISTSWEPTNSGVYAVGWVTTELPNFLTMEQIISGNITFNMSETYLLDNFIARNVFVGSPPNCSILFPTVIPNKPLELRFPLDFAYNNLTIVSSHSLEDVQVFYSGNATQLFNNTPQKIILDNYANILVSFNTTLFPRPGYYEGLIQITANGEQLGNVSINFNLSYPEGRLFFDSIHREVGLETWEKRLESIYSGYHQLSEVLYKQGCDIDEIPSLSEYQAELLTFYDGILIFSPQKGFTEQEISLIHSLLHNGTSILICLEPQDECNWTAVNLITEPYGITAISSEPGTKIITSLSQSHPVTRNLNSIEMENVAILNVNASTGAVVLANTSDGGIVIAAAEVGYGKLLVIGDSSVFDSRHINLLDNTQLVVNAVNWLLENRIILHITLFLPNPDGKIHLGENLYADIHVTDIHGKEITSNITLLTVYILPNGTFLPIPAFQTDQPGWYVGLFLTAFTNETGDYTMILYADAHNYTTTHYIYNFRVEPEKPTISALYYPQASREYVLFGFTLIGTITLIVVSAYLLERRRLRKKILIPELDRELRNTIRNTVNEVRAVLKSLDRELSQKGLDDFDKLRIIHEKLGRLRIALDKAKAVAERVGE